jgi:hypothetical protein
MRTTTHENLVVLFKNRPSLAAEILGEVMGVALPPYTEARLASTNLTESQPAGYRPDLSVVLLDGDRPVLVINVEVQLVVDPKKRLRWPAYVTISSLIHGCPANLLVVAPDPVVADWCAEPIEIGVPGFVLRPPVLRRAAVPAVTDILEAVRRPEFGLLSVMAHGETELGAIVAAAVLPAIQSLTNNRTKMYRSFVHNHINDEAHQELEAAKMGYFAAMGRAEGRAQEAARNLLTVLRVRGIEVPDAVRERILAQKDKDLDRLERWLDRAVVAASADEVIDEPN